MPDTSRSINRQLNAADLFLKNINQEDLLYSMKALGYKESLLYKGEELYEKALHMVEEKKRLENNYRSARAEFQDTSKVARNHFMKMLGVVKGELREEETLLELLKVKGITPRTYLGWTSKAKYFYKTMQTHPQVILKLENKVDQDYLDHGIQKLKDLDGLIAAQEDAKGKYQQATVNQKEALAALHKWYQKIANLCRIVFKKDLKQLVRLGIKPLYPPRKTS